MIYKPKTNIIQGIVEYETPNDMYLGVLDDFLTNAKCISRKGRLYLTFKPYTFRIKNISNTMITLPGSNYHDPIPWLFSELFDWLHGPIVAGGRSIRFDKHRRTVYPRANGEDDWSYKAAFGATGQNQINWALRHVRVDPTSRSCVITPWQWERDLVRYTAKKEADIARGEEYQRLPCMLAVQFSKDETLNKGLNIMVNQRALDFTGAIHTDVFRIAEVGHFLGIQGYAGGYAGHLTSMTATNVIEAYGAGRFEEFKRLKEWWTSDPRILNLLSLYPQTNQCLNQPIYPGSPAKLAYNWYEAEWKTTELAINNAIKNQWELFEQRAGSLKYQYFKDLAYTMAVFEYCLMEELAPEIRAYHWDAEQCNKSRTWLKGECDYPPFYFLSQIKGWMHYYVSTYLAINFIAREEFELLEKLFSVGHNAKIKDCILIDASRFLSKKQRDGYKDKEFSKLYNDLFVSEPKVTVTVKEPSNIVKGQTLL